MIEHYGKIVALDGSEYHYGDFKESRQEAVALATARDQAIRGASPENGSPVDNPRVVGTCHARGNAAEQAGRGHREALAQ